MGWGWEVLSVEHLKELASNLLWFLAGVGVKDLVDRIRGWKYIRR